VDGPDTGTGQHGVGGLRDHRHVDAHPVAFLHTAGLERVGELAHVFLQFAVGNVLAVCGVVSLPDQGRLVGALRQVPVYAVVADIEFAAAEPGRFALDEVITDHLVPGLVPGQELVGHFAPETLRVLYRAFVHGLVLLRVDVGILEIGGNRAGWKLGHGSHSHSCLVNTG
jgi:hypothetical protein